MKGRDKTALPLASLPLEGQEGVGDVRLLEPLLPGDCLVVAVLVLITRGVEGLIQLQNAS